MSISRAKHIMSFITIFFLFGCSKSFPVIPFSQEEIEYKTNIEEEINEDDGFTGRLELARLLFIHNYIDNADHILEEIVTNEPQNMEALAWYGANNCKKSGKLFDPWFLGLRKLYLVKKCLNQIDRAVEQQPDNYTITLISINTGAEVDIFGSLKTARKRMEELNARIEKNRSSYPAEVMAPFYQAASLVEEKSGNLKKAKEYQQIIIDQFPNSKMAETAKIKLNDLGGI